jgi:hypothetical protein
VSFSAAAGANHCQRFTAPVRVSVPVRDGDRAVVVKLLLRTRSIVFSPPKSGVRIRSELVSSKLVS